jgi:hypothetical protein
MGTITNLNLELDATIAHQDVLVNTFDLHVCTIHTGSDNTPAVDWQRKGSTTTTKAQAVLLHLQAIHQWHHCYCPFFSHIPGIVNTMVDNASCL